LKSGDHIVCCDDTYGGTGRQFREVAEKIYGMVVDFVDLNTKEDLEAAITPDTKVSSNDCRWFG
jgi:O-acetylhomoserine/O-acetylserine sulfhydrylase-like pyridoxal-dependent enzyme